MLKTIEGISRHGRIELTEEPSDVREETRVLVTFLEPNQIDLRARGMDEAQAAELRARLAPCAEDWESPEMDIYDEYDAAKGRLQAGCCGPGPLSPLQFTDRQASPGACCTRG